MLILSNLGSFSSVLWETVSQFCFNFHFYCKWSWSNFHIWEPCILYFLCDLKIIFCILNTSPLIYVHIHVNTYIIYQHIYKTNSIFYSVACVLCNWVILFLLGGWSFSSKHVEHFRNLQSHHPSVRMLIAPQFHQHLS